MPSKSKPDPLLSGSRKSNKTHKEHVEPVQIDLDERHKISEKNLTGFKLAEQAVPLDPGEQPLGKVFDYINASIAYLDRSGNFVQVNPAFARALGQEPRDFIGKNAFEMNPNAESRALFERILKEGMPFSAYDLPYTDPAHPERGITYWDWTLQPIVEHGEVTGIIFTSTEVTERKRAEKALEETQALFQLLFEAAPDANILMDEYGHILAVNHKTEEVFGHQRYELNGKPVEIFLPEQDRQKYAKRLVDYMHGSRRLALGSKTELQALRRDGSAIPVQVTLSPLQTEAGLMVLAVVRDVTEQKQAEENLRLSEARFRAIFNEAATGMQLVSASGAMLETNPMMQVMLGYSEEELRGMSFLQFTHPDDLPRNLALFNSLLEGEIQQFQLEKRYIRKDGSIFWGRMNVSRYDERKGEAPFVIVMVEDVTPRKEAEEALHRQETLLRAVVDTLPVGVWIAGRSGSIQYVNPAAMMIWGGAEYVGEEGYLKYKAYWARTGKPVQVHERGLYRAIHFGETSVEEELIIETFDGQRKTILNSAAPIWGSEQQISGAIVVNQDISERRRMEAELAEVQRKLLSNAEEERLRLARELHDGPIQELYGMSFQLNELRDQLTECAQQELLDKAGSTLTDTISALRSMMSELRPPTLAPFGLERTIRSHVEVFQRKHPELRLHLNLMRDGQKLPEPLRLALFRIYQESLNNILRHAHAANVYVIFRLDETTAELSVRDDGMGFKAPEHWVELARKGHYGLVGMRERAEALGGKFELVSAPGKGTTYHAVVPIK